MSVHRPRENCPGYSCYSGGLSGGADGLRFGTHGRFGAPGRRAGLEIYCMKSAALFRIQHKAKSPGRLRISDAAKVDIGDCDVDVIRIRRRSPLTPTELAALAGASLPKDLATLIR